MSSEPTETFNQYMDRSIRTLEQEGLEVNIKQLIEEWDKRYPDYFKKNKDDDKS